MDGARLRGTFHDKCNDLNVTLKTATECGEMISAK